MNIKGWILWITLGLAANSSALAQGTFTNLGFEAASVLPQQPTGTFVDIALALPGWSAFIGTQPVVEVLYNSETIGSANVSLTGVSTSGLDAIEGNFSVLLQAGFFIGPGGPYAQASLHQAGQIPAGAESIRFKALSLNSSIVPPFTVSLDGQALSLVPLSVMPSYTLFGADISSFAGTVKELSFAVNTPDGRLNNLHLDSIVFSSDPIVPEPGILALVALGALLVVSRVRRKKEP